MIGNTTKQNLLVMILGITLASCQKHDKTKLQEQELTQWIDQKNYHEVIRWFDEHPNSEEARTLKVYQAYAYLGLGNLVPLEFVLKVQNPQSFEDKALEAFFSNCANSKLEVGMSTVDKCFSLRLLNAAPVPEDLRLRRAREVLHELKNEGRLSQQDLILFGFLESAFVLGRIRKVLLAYAALDPEKISYDEAKKLFDEVRLAGLDMKNFVGTLKEQKALLSQKLTGLPELPLFQLSQDDKLEFLESTGFPLFLQVTEMDDESTVGMVGRNAIIQVLDEGYSFFAK